jgi:hypothetical protein
MSNLTVDETKAISEGLGLEIDTQDSDAGIIWARKPKEQRWKPFDPLCDADAMKVLMALVELCKDKEFYIDINPHNEFNLRIVSRADSDAFFFKDELSNLSICRAFLAVLGEG